MKEREPEVDARQPTFVSLSNDLNVGAKNVKNSTSAVPQQKTPSKKSPKICNKNGNSVTLQELKVKREIESLECDQSEDEDTSKNCPKKEKRLTPTKSKEKRKISTKEVEKIIVDSLVKNHDGEETSSSVTKIESTIDSSKDIEPSVIKLESPNDPDQDKSVTKNDSQTLKDLKTCPNEIVTPNGDTHDQDPTENPVSTDLENTDPYLSGLDQDTDELFHALDSSQVVVLSNFDESGNVEEILIILEPKSLDEPDLYEVNEIKQTDMEDSAENEAIEKLETGQANYEAVSDSSQEAIVKKDSEEIHADEPLNTDLPLQEQENSPQEQSIDGTLNPDLQVKEQEIKLQEQGADGNFDLPDQQPEDSPQEQSADETLILSAQETVQQELHQEAGDREVISGEGNEGNNPVEESYPESENPVNVAGETEENIIPENDNALDLLALQGGNNFESFLFVANRTCYFATGSETN